MRELTLDTVTDLLKAGGVITYPTEAVWGLGCDPANESAVHKVLALKQRPVEKGMILVAASAAQLDGWVDLAALRKYTIWNAHYGVSSSPIDCDMWQGTEKARINGYSGELDANISYMG